MPRDDATKALARDIALRRRLRSLFRPSYVGGSLSSELLDCSAIFWVPISLYMSSKTSATNSSFGGAGRVRTFRSRSERFWGWAVRDRFCGGLRVRISLRRSLKQRLRFFG